MPRHLLRAIFTFIVPGGLVFVAALGFLRPQGLPPWCQGPVTALPYIALTFGLVFGWYFASTRMLLSLATLTVAGQASTTWPLDEDPTSISRTIFAASTFLLPVNLLALSLVKEMPGGTLRMAVRVLPFMLQPFLVLWLCHPAQQDVARAFEAVYLPGWSTTWTPVPQGALLVFLSAGLMLCIRFALQRNPMDAGAFWALVAVFFAYHGTRLGWSPTNFFSTAGLIVFFSLVQAAYQETYRDELTGIPGRLAYEEATAQLGNRYALAVLAFDQLKVYAGAHGKPVVQQVLKLVASKVQAACQAGRVFRVSGEELTLLFPHQSALEALVELEKIRKMIESTSLVLRGAHRVWEHTGAALPGRKDQVLAMTASIGVSDTSSEEVTRSVVIKAAYRALYEAKTAGGNAVKRAMATAQSFRRSRSHPSAITTGHQY